MFKGFAPLFIMLFALTARAQNPMIAPPTLPYGKVDTAELKMQSCSFEKDANAEILIDKCLIHSGDDFPMERHVRIKIFNDFGKKYANVRLVYHTGFLEGKSISSVEGETFNLEDNGKVVITPLEKSQVFTEKINKSYSAVVFTFANVKAGSVLDYKYRGNRPQTWYFQSDLPTGYSEIEAYFRASVKYAEINVQPFAVSSGANSYPTFVRGMAYVRSLTDEPYMTARRTNLQRIEFLPNIKELTWSYIASNFKLLDGYDELSDKLAGEDGIIKKANSLAGDEEKIAFIFDTVKYSMAWNNQMGCVTSDNLKKAWGKKTGNSADINLITCHFLKGIGINATPMLVCTRDFGRLSPYQPDYSLMDNTVVYVRDENAGIFVLDGSNRFNLYNTTPFNLLNSYGMSINTDAGNYRSVLMRDTVPVTQTVFVNAELRPGNKIAGNVEITSNSYHLVDAVSRYKTLGEEKYLELLRKGDNNLKITSFKMENASIDAGPLTQKMDFEQSLAGSDENYIYFNTNLFSQIEDNPFKSESRNSDIDLGYRNNLSMSGIYKIPSGYKIDALPKSVTIVMPGNSIVFKRVVAFQDGAIMVRYSINHRKTIYFKQEYQDLRGFYLRMYELLNEQAVLKKM